MYNYPISFQEEPKEIRVKKVKWLIVPGLLTAVALFSFSLLQQQYQYLHSHPEPSISREETEKSWSRPASLPPLVSNTLVLLITGTSDKGDAFSTAWFDGMKPEAVRGSFTHANTQDEAYLLFQLLSGQQENLSISHTVQEYQTHDHLLQLAKSYKINTAAYSSMPDFPTDKPVSIAETLSPAGFPTGNNQLTLLHVRVGKDSVTPEQVTEWLALYEKKNLSEKNKYQVYLLTIPEKKTEGLSWIRNNTARSRFLYWNTLSSANEPNQPVLPYDRPIEDMTATIAYSLGIVPPTGCLGKPITTLFPIEESQTMERFVHHADQIILSSIYYLYQYQLDDSIITGFLLEANDTIHAVKSASMVELERRYKTILDDFNSFHLYQQKKINMIPSLVFTLLALLCLLIWLFNWLARYRAYVFGSALFLAYVLLERYVFPSRLSMPVFSTLSIPGILLNQLLFILPIISVLIIAYTFLAGYWFDSSFEEICRDINGFFVSMAVLMLLFTATWINRFGLIRLSMMPPFGVQHNQIHHLSLWVLMPFLLVFSYGLSYGLIRLSLALGSRHGQHS